MEYEEYNINRTVPLTLSSYYISSDNANYPYYIGDVSSSVGVISLNRSKYTWNSINLEQLLGDLYHDHEYFNLELVYFMIHPKSNGGDAFNSIVYPEHRAINIWIEGLEWVNSSYNGKNDTNRAKAYLGGYGVNYGFVVNGTYEQFDQSYELSNLKFKKNKQNPNITISIGSVSSLSGYDTTDDFSRPNPDTFATSGKIFSHVSFKFNIRPCVN